MKTKRLPKKYLVAVKAQDGTGVFEFPSLKARAEFVKTIKKHDPNAQYALTV